MRNTEDIARPRRTGDTIAIDGEYQHRATHQSQYAAQRFWHQKRFEACLELLELAPGMRVLDAGCGSGVFSDQIARSPGVHVVAVDANAAAVGFVQHTYARENLEVRRGQVDELAFEPGSFDRIACLEVIEHIHLEQARTMLQT
ncbi:MAG TPA: methyltransferase domain-containing protein, partial [Polyangiales bacterium]|nr:methyltransferase domain-containing protein [Polyangiales bacterium]